MGNLPPGGGAGGPHCPVDARVLGSAWQPRGPAWRRGPRPAALCHPLALRSQPAARPKAATPIQGCPVGQAPRRHTATAPQGTPPEAAGRPAWAFSAAPQPGAAPAQRPTASQPPPRAPRSPQESGPTSSGTGAAQPRMHTQAHRRTKTIFSAGRAAEVISSRGGSPRPRPARPRRAPCGPQGRLLALLAPRGQVCAPPLLNRGATSALLSPRSEQARERRKPGGKFSECK